MTKLPFVRSSDLVVQETGSELLIYDLKSHKAYCLNETSALVYRSCDGKTSYNDLKRTNPKLSEEVYKLALSELSKLGLLTETYGKDFSRRDLLQKAAASALVLPLITGLHVPASGQAGSCVGDGLPCSLNNPGSCCSQTCINANPSPSCGCVPDGGSCSLGNPGACCSQTCINGSPSPACTCLPSGSTCNLNNPGDCCSQTCINGNPSPTCA
ncbi:MAG: hypothetical protein R2681_13670 [Pyrinomonadaceae bacterium]